MVSKADLVMQCGSRIETHNVHVVWLSFNWKFATSDAKWNSQGVSSCDTLEWQLN